MRFFSFFLIAILIAGCEENQTDTTPPTVSISSPVSGQTVFEVVTISVTTQDNEGVSRVQFFVDDTLLSTDSEFPFEYLCDTTSYPDNSSHVIYVSAYDEAGNCAETQPILLLVDNSDSLPTVPYLYPISFQDNAFTIHWSRNDDLDFYSYTLHESDYPDMEDYSDVYETTSANDTSFVRAIADNVTKFYSVTSTDTIGLATSSNTQQGLSWVHFVSTFGDSMWYEEGFALDQTTDGGYIMTGFATESIHDWYLWLVKANSDGDKEWDVVFSYGESNSNMGTSVKQTLDGGYIITGVTLNDYNGTEELYLLKTDTFGAEQWSRTFSGESRARGSSVIQTADGGYVICGMSMSGNSTKMLIVKTDQNGDEEWWEVFGSSANGSSIKQTDDGGYIATGDSHSRVLLVKVDSDGSELWSQTYSINGYDVGLSVQQTNDGGFVIAGYTAPYSGYASDLLLIKSDSEGEFEWSSTYGGEYSDLGYSVQLTLQNSLVICGYTRSFGGVDVLLVEADLMGNALWIQPIGGESAEKAFGCLQTSDGGYSIVGSSTSQDNTDILLVKTDPNGNTAPFE